MGMLIPIPAALEQKPIATIITTVLPIVIVLQLVTITQIIIHLVIIVILYLAVITVYQQFQQRVIIQHLLTVTATIHFPRIVQLVSIYTDTKKPKDNLRQEASAF